MRAAAAGVLAVACVVAVCVWTAGSAGQRGVVLNQVRCTTPLRTQRPLPSACQGRRVPEWGILAMSCLWLLLMVDALAGGGRV